MNDDDGTNDDIGDDADDSSSQHSGNDSSEQQQYQGQSHQIHLPAHWGWWWLELESLCFDFIFKIIIMLTLRQGKEIFIERTVTCILFFCECIDSDTIK